MYMDNDTNTYNYRAWHVQSSIEIFVFSAFSCLTTSSNELYTFLESVSISYGREVPL